MVVNVCKYYCRIYITPLILLGFNVLTKSLFLFMILSANAFFIEIPHSTTIKNETIVMVNTAITALVARKVWSSSGLPALEVEVFINKRISARAITQSGLSGGYVDPILNSEKICANLHKMLDYKIEYIRNILTPKLLGQRIDDQIFIDSLLSSCTQNNSLSNADTAAISISVADLAAKYYAIPLWKYIQKEDFEPIMPLPEIEIFGGGAHASYASTVQDVMVIAPGAENYQHALCIGAEIFQRIKNQLVKAGKPTGLCEKGGLWPSYDHFSHALEMVSEAIALSGLTAGKDIGIAIDFAADGFYDSGHYWLNGKKVCGQHSDEYIATLTSLVKKFPIMSLEDPLAVEDRAGYRELMQLLGNEVQIISDDLLDSDPQLVQSEDAALLCNAIMIKPAKSGTLTKTISALRHARNKGWGAIMAGRSIDSEDTAVMHLAVGLGIGQFKIGSLARAERSAKFNEGIRIAEASRELVFAGAKELP
jgi:enolase